ncbi:hypothetical protein [Allobaculum sp. Allo2]|uniref:hypothetical protein n=1 Tax=Allobaculum sp. Allo2 TaxID=2853432 RepID=UPI001F61BF46|nr:hypothetical protein [Allobaculum sp. Allo2]UNT94219.1 hypothetical protein KWG61_06305 [Allobaculum sp. Allo2]
MAEFLKARYPDKTILMAGSQEGMDSISDAQMEQSLALLCDTATGERVDDLRFTRAKRLPVLTTTFSSKTTAILITSMKNRRPLLRPQSIFLKAWRNADA